MQKIIKAQITKSVLITQAMLENDSIIKTISDVSVIVINALKAGHKVLWAGNGGSAADAQHMAAELVNKFRLERPGLCSIALTTDTSILTSIGNDYGFQRVFARQVEAIGRIHRHINFREFGEPCAGRGGVQAQRPCLRCACGGKAMQNGYV